MELFIKENPNLITYILGLLMSFFLWSSNQTLARINKTLSQHQELLLNLTTEFSRLRGEHDIVMRGRDRHSE